MLSSKLFRGFCLIAVLGATAAGAPVVRKFDPPNWWAGHSRNPLQVMLTGEGLTDCRVESADARLQVETRHTSDDGRYLFAYITAPRNLTPGMRQFEVNCASGSTSFSFEYDSPVDRRGRFQGFTSRDVIYLLMPDRFANGDPTNDSPSAFPQFPADRSKRIDYHGGDFAGVEKHLQYVKELGANAVWMLPVYSNSSTKSAPSHGYHTVDFYAPEPRFGSMEELTQLVNAAHRMGLKVMQDQVVNHTGPYHPWLDAPPTRTWFNFADRMPRVVNPFDIPSLANPHANPERKLLTLKGWFVGELPDLNQEDPLVSDYLIQNSLWWIAKTGIDGIRMDTYPYTDRPFWQDWQTALNAEFPGFFVVGEITAPTPASLSFFQGGVTHDGIDTKLPAMLDFPLNAAIRAVFGEGKSMKQLATVLGEDHVYLHPEMLVPFIGNHDMPRFLNLAGGRVERLEMALAFLLTTRGIPHLYYGDEIGLGTERGNTDWGIRAEFPGGFPPVPGVDQRNAFAPEGRRGEAARIWNFTHEMLGFRAKHPAIWNGTLTEISVEDDLYAYLCRSAGEEVLVVLNRKTGGAPVRLNLEPLGVEAGASFESFGSSGKAIVVNPDRALTVGAENPVTIAWRSRNSPVR